MRLFFRTPRRTMISLAKAMPISPSRTRPGRRCSKRSLALSSSPSSNRSHTRCATSQNSQALMMPLEPRARSVNMWRPAAPPMTPLMAGQFRLTSAPMLWVEGGTSSLTQLTCSISVHNVTI